MEQWVFVLPGADDQSECMFFANPSIAGYDVEDGAAVNLTVDFGEKVYTVALSKTARKDWYASEKYDIAPSAWKKDYKLRVEISGTDKTEESTAELSKQEVTAAWPEIRNQEQLQEEIADNSLFEYTVEDETTVVITDPAGNEEVAEMSGIAAAGTGFGVGIVALAVIAVAVIVVLLLKKKIGNVGAAAKETRILEAREAVEKCCKRLEFLARRSENILHEIRMTGQVAEERIRQDGEASAYDINDIRTMIADAEDLVQEPCCENVDTMRGILGGVSQNLLKMQGNAVTKKDNGSRNELDNPRNYLDASKRQEILAKIEIDADSAENLCEELNTILKTLKEIAYREEMPFEKDVCITVTDGHGEYETRRACKEAYGAAAPGVFSLDALKFLSKNESWLTLPEIIGQKTDIRIFAIDDSRMRAIAERPIIVRQGKNQRIVEFSYDEDVVLGLRDHVYTEIRLHFEK